MKIYLLLAVALAIIFPAELKKDHIPIRKKGYCVWYDHCPHPRPYPSYLPPRLNCLYNGPAKTMNDTKGIQLLQELCPQYAADRKTCCSTNLLVALKDKFGYFSKNCPACHQNMMNMLCQLTCSPDQSLFMEPVRVIPYKSDIAITMLKAYVSPMFKQMLLDSCKDVLSFFSRQDSILERLCYVDVPYCTPKKLFNHMFSSRTDIYSRAALLFPDVLPKKMKWMEVTAYRCNESFVTPWNNQTKPSCSCKNCLLACPRPTPGPKYAGSNALVHKKGHCIWYDKCQGSDQLDDEYCLYNGPAKTLNDTKGVKLLKKMCPQYAANRKTCCSAKLLDDMQYNVYFTVDKLTRDCPACHQNLMTMYCELICSPDQSLYVSPQMVKHHNSKAQITQLNYYVSSTFKKVLYDSCKDVIVPYSDSMALETRFLCARKASACTPQKLVENIGRMESGNYPISTLFPESLAQNMTWMDKAAYKCNKGFTTPWNKRGRSCYCDDCASACPKPNRSPPGNLHSHIYKLSLKIQKLLSNIAKKASKP